MPIFGRGGDMEHFKNNPRTPVHIYVNPDLLKGVSRTVLNRILKSKLYAAISGRDVQFFENFVSDLSEGFSYLSEGEFGLELRSLSFERMDPDSKHYAINLTSPEIITKINQGFIVFIGYPTDQAATDSHYSGRGVIVMGCLGEPVKKIKFACIHEILHGLGMQHPPFWLQERGHQFSPEEVRSVDNLSIGSIGKETSLTDWFLQISTPTQIQLGWAKIVGCSLSERGTFLEDIKRFKETRFAETPQASDEQLHPTRRAMIKAGLIGAVSATAQQLFGPTKTAVAVDVRGNVPVAGIIKELYPEKSAEDISRIEKALAPFLSWQRFTGLDWLISLINRRLDGNRGLTNELISLLIDPDIVEAIDNSRLSDEKKEYYRYQGLSACGLRALIGYIVLRSKGFEVMGIDVAQLFESRKQQMAIGTSHSSSVIKLEDGTFKQFDPALRKVSEEFDLETAYTQGEYYLELTDGSRKDLHRKIRLVSPVGLVATLYSNLGVFYKRIGHLDKAIAILNKAKDLDSQDAPIHSNLGTAYYRSGQFDEAIANHKRSIELNPEDAQPYVNLGNAYQGQGRFMDAVTAYKQALKLEPEFALAYNNLGVAYRRLGQSNDAIAAYKKAIGHDKNLASAYTNLGAAYKKLGKLKEAINCSKRALKLDPQDADIHNNLGNIYFTLGQFRKAVAAYKQATQLNPRLAIAYYNLGGAYTKMKKFQKAATALEKAAELNPKDADIHNNLGNAYQELDQLEKAITVYKKAIMLDPQDASPYSGLGNSYYTLGKFKEATVSYKKAIELDPQDPGAYHNLGLAYYRLGQTKDAINILNKALKFTTDPSEKRRLSEIIEGIKEDSTGEQGGIIRLDEELRVAMAAPFLEIEEKIAARFSEQRRPGMSGAFGRLLDDAFAAGGIEYARLDRLYRATDGVTRRGFIVSASAAGAIAGAIGYKVIYDYANVTVVQDKSGRIIFYFQDHAEKVFSKIEPQLQKLVDEQIKAGNKVILLQESVFPHGVILDGIHRYMRAEENQAKEGMKELKRYFGRILDVDKFRDTVYRNQKALAKLDAETGMLTAIVSKTVEEIQAMHNDPEQLPGLIEKLEEQGKPFVADGCRFLLKPKNTKLLLEGKLTVKLETLVDFFQWFDFMEVSGHYLYDTLWNLSKEKPFLPYKHPFFVSNAQHVFSRKALQDVVLERLELIDSFRKATSKRDDTFVKRANDLAEPGSVVAVTRGELHESIVLLKLKQAERPAKSETHRGLTEGELSPQAVQDCISHFNSMPGYELMVREILGQKPTQATRERLAVLSVLESILTTTSGCFNLGEEFIARGMKRARQINAFNLLLDIRKNYFVMLYRNKQARRINPQLVLPADITAVMISLYEAGIFSKDDLTRITKDDLQDTLAFIEEFNGAKRIISRWIAQGSRFSEAAGVGLDTEERQILDSTRAIGQYLRSAPKWTHRSLMREYIKYLKKKALPNRAEAARFMRQREINMARIMKSLLSQLVKTGKWPESEVALARQLIRQGAMERNPYFDSIPYHTAKTRVIKAFEAGQRGLDLFLNENSSTPSPETVAQYVYKYYYQPEKTIPPFGQLMKNFGYAESERNHTFPSRTRVLEALIKVSSKAHRLAEKTWFKTRDSQFHADLERLLRAYTKRMSEENGEPVDSNKSVVRILRAAQRLKVAGGIVTAPRIAAQMNMSYKNVCGRVNIAIADIEDGSDPFVRKSGQLPKRKSARFTEIEEKIDELEVQNLEYGLQKGIISNKNRPFYEALDQMFLENGLENDKARDRLARTLAKMKPGSIEILGVFDVISDKATAILRRKNPKGLDTLTPREKLRLTNTFKAITSSYESLKNKETREGLMRRLVPLSLLEDLERYTGTSRTNIQAIAVGWTDFPIIIKKMKSKAAKIKGDVMGASNAWGFLRAHGPYNVDEALRKARPKVNSIKDKVGGLFNAWTIVRIKSNDTDSWVANTEGRVNRLVSKQGFTETVAWAYAVSHTEDPEDDSDVAVARFTEVTNTLNKIDFQYKATPNISRPNVAILDCTDAKGLALLGAHFTEAPLAFLVNTKKEAARFAAGAIVASLEEYEGDTIAATIGLRDRLSIYIKEKLPNARPRFLLYTMQKLKQIANIEIIPLIERNYTAIAQWLKDMIETIGIQYHLKDEKRLMDAFEILGRAI